MALNAALEELLKTLPADVQTQQRAILEKHPALGEGWLRQADYDRQMNEGKAKIKNAEEVQDWFKRTKPVHEQVVKDLNEAQEKISRLEAEVTAKAAEAAAAIAAAGGGSADAEKVAKAVMDNLGKTIPTKAELASLIATETEKQANAARDKFFKEDVPATLTFITGMNDVQFRYRDEFGKSLDKKEFSKFMTDNKIADPIEAYEKYTEKARHDKELESERVKIREEERLKLKSEFVPGSTGSHGTGHLQVRISEKKAGDPLFGQDIELGDNSAAMAAAAEMRAEGKL